MVQLVEGGSSPGCTVLVHFFSKLFNLQNSAQTQGDVVYGALSESHPQRRRETLNMSITATEEKHLMP